ncbi:uncharacterized protein C8Q71DRAFT_11986 [Rhodofomes roseus]|uniref:F-box domain-containing protein n=1 Tax=Rhodofomes roseus TaxID=34475 RepID=A0ABQ8KWQ9_9APHY|nr:uncharacterized protein C8Q71DRAFT_11986 [Rhodofomes roseus]KAH9843737.1 hypothetical protein C8Q71DRAFT_11986 [Rhodofomes roseus]
MSAVRDKEPVERVREQIDQEIAQLRQSVQVLIARRNELAPVLRLPVELLSEVFVLNATTHSPDDLRWTNVAYVCQYWRSVAVQTPRLWTCINFKAEPWVALQLERSKNMPLVAHVDLRARQFVSKCEGFGLLARSMDRVRRLTISSGEMRGTVHKLWRHMTYPAPILESFVFHNPSQTRAGPTSHVPTQLFRGECPSLQYVELRQCTWCWATTLFSHTVTHLTLDGHNVQMRTSLEEILSALELMPNLEWLDLDHITPEVPWFFIPNVGVGQFVHLARLKFLRIDALALNTAIMLYHISFPMETQLALCCDAFRRLDEFIAVGHAISSKYRREEGMEDRRLKSFTFKPHSSQALELIAWNQPYSADELHNDARSSDAAVRLLLRWEGREPDFSVASLLYACRALPLETVRTFYVPEYVSLTGQAWIELFSGMKNVSSVWVQGRSATHLPDALRRENCSQCRIDITGEMSVGDPMRQHTRVPSLFPLLHTLTLEEVDFTGDTCPDACFFWQLQDVVLERTKQANRLKLIIHRCRNFILEQMQDLRMVGADVTWTGEEILDFDLRDVDSDDSEEDYEDYYDRAYSDDDDSDSDD